MPNEVKLLPCPFCGAEAEMQPWHGGGPDKQLVGCSEHSYECAVGPSVTGETPEEAADLWNTRPTIVTDEVVKRVARAICETALGHGTNDQTWIAFEDAQHIAHAAIAAMPAIVGGEGRGDLREALTKAHEFAVMFLAFDGRDRHTDRMDRTFDDLSKMAREVDDVSRSALAQPEPTP